jgi:BirA family transcriptional regulator, biotin operon repressor / biotin---[acetyl-CoA-carboxylase] ligase
VSTRDLTADHLAPLLHTRWLARPYEFLASCGSTNDEVSTRAAADAKEGLVVATDQQSKGRGRRGRSWHSPAGQSLYFSILLRPALPAPQVGPLPLLAGATLARALDGLGFAPRLKWPNDVLLETPEGLRKVAGILAEMATESGRVRHVVLGVGINVNTREFPPELAAYATSLSHGRGGDIDRLAVLAGFLHAFEPAYEEFVAAGPGPALSSWQEFAFLGQECWVDSGSGRIEGIAEGVDGSGALLMRTPDGALVPVHAGEINWRKPQ